MPIFHAKSAGNRSKLDKPQTFIKMPCVDIAFHDGIELQYAEPQLPAFHQAVQHQLLSNMLPACVR